MNKIAVSMVVIGIILCAIGISLSFIEDLYYFSIPISVTGFFSLFIGFVFLGVENEK